MITGSKFHQAHERTWKNCQTGLFNCECIKLDLSIISCLCPCTDKLVGLHSWAKTKTGYDSWMLANAGNDTEPESSKGKYQGNIGLWLFFLLHFTTLVKRLILKCKMVTWEINWAQLAAHTGYWVHFGVENPVSINLSLTRRIFRTGKLESLQCDLNAWEVCLRAL